jgi:hypothetical protein
MMSPSGARCLRRSVKKPSASHSRPGVTVVCIRIRVENRRQLVDVRDPGTADERRRSLGQHPDDVLEEALSSLALADEDLDR